jgi:hypothetical protein
MQWDQSGETAKYAKGMELKIILGGECIAGNVKNRLLFIFPVMK